MYTLYATYAGAGSNWIGTAETLTEAKKLAHERVTAPAKSPDLIRVTVFSSRGDECYSEKAD